QYLVTDEIGKVFRTITIQKTNEYLKLALTTANIKKKVTFHCSRHTFATCSITLGIPYEVVSKLLGHTDLKTTQIYAKIVDEVKIKEIDKWNF
ncbi:MAG TPA: site-specific integrase, partial [Flavobacterium sp.]|nr:site-specific integrase [Flavobacterium sp.]